MQAAPPDPRQWFRPFAKAAFSYGVGVLGVPAWVDVAVPAAMCCLTGIAALLPALRAGG